MSVTSDRGEKALLDIRQLTKVFPIGHDLVHACSDVTLSVCRGETVGVIGESGSGKTTLGRCLLRLVEPTSGEVTFEGVNLAALSANEMRRMRSDLQIVFQEPFDSLDPQMTVGRQITEPLRIHRHVGRRECAARATELLELVGLERSIARSLPGRLSPGVLQRASIARAIATEPKLIVLDEPTSALSPEAEVQIIALLKQLQARLDLTYIFISHDLSLIGSICDRVLVMYLGQVVETGAAADVLRAPAHPYSRALLDSVLLARPGDRRGRRERLEGEIPSPINLPRACYLAGRCSHVTDRCREEPQQLSELAGGAREVRCWRAAAGELSAYAGIGVGTANGAASLPPDELSRVTPLSPP